MKRSMTTLLFEMRISKICDRYDQENIKYHHSTVISSWGILHLVLSIHGKSIQLLTSLFEITVVKII